MFSLPPRESLLGHRSQPGHWREGWQLQKGQWSPRAVTDAHGDGTGPGSVHQCPEQPVCSVLHLDSEEGASLVALTAETTLPNARHIPARPPDRGNSIGIKNRRLCLWSDEKQTNAPRNPCHAHLRVMILAEGSLSGKYGFYSTPCSQMDCKWQLIKKQLRIQANFSHHYRELGASLKTIGRLHFQTTLAKQKPADRSAEAKCSATLVWPTKPSVSV